MVRFLTREEIENIHAVALEIGDGVDGVRDESVLLSAIALPQATFDGVYLYPTLEEMAAALLVSLCKNHPFFDGNKRTATLAMLSFMALNGKPVEMGEEALADLVLHVVDGTLGKDEVVVALATHS